LARRNILLPRMGKHIAAMQQQRAPSSNLERILCAVRDARFSQHIHCPRCQGKRVHHWGSFSSRQRYRCLECRRTFSDLTLTAAAYTKRLAKWPAYLNCVIRSQSIRRSATNVGVHPCTAFRWRHRILEATDRCDRRALSGLIEVAETGFPYSEKGRRHLARLARRRGFWQYSPRTLTARYVCVVVACDRDGNVVSGLVPRRHPYDDDWRGRIFSRVLGCATIMARYLALSPCGRAARLSGHAYIHVPRFPSAQYRRPLQHTFNVVAYVARLRAWLPRFRGVATRYLQHYLAWHRLLDSIDVRAGIAILTRSLPHMV
jgi:transposase-like protein